MKIMNFYLVFFWFRHQLRPRRKSPHQVVQEKDVLALIENKQRVDQENRVALHHIAALGRDSSK